LQGSPPEKNRPGKRQGSISSETGWTPKLKYTKILERAMLTKPAKELILKPSKWGQRNRWFTIGPLRNTTRCIEAAEHQCLDVASIDVADKGKGHFTRFLTELEKFIDENRPSISICVENALELRFQGFLRRRPNYVPCNPPDVCFIRRSPESHQLR